MGEDVPDCAGGHRHSPAAITAIPVSARAADRSASRDAPAPTRQTAQH
jgi:hypothetical protein